MVPIVVIPKTIIPHGNIVLIVILVVGFIYLPIRKIDFSAEGVDELSFYFDIIHTKGKVLLRSVSFWIEEHQ